MTRLRAISAAVLLAATYLLVTMQGSAVQPHPRYAYVVSIPDAGLDAGALCAFRAGLVAPSVLNVWFKDAGATSSEYAVAKICAPVYDADAGDDAGSLLPPSYYVLPDLSPMRADVWDGGPQVEVWRQGHPSAPYACACATDAGSCIQTSDGGEALHGVTLGAGQWSGAGCLPKSCVELAGQSSWPTECWP